MGTDRVDAIWFTAYPNDHLPIHVHGFCGQVQVIVDLLDNGAAVLSARTKSISPRTAKSSDVRRILDTAAANYSTLKALWEKNHA